MDISAGVNGFLLIIIAILIYWNGKLRFQRNDFKRKSELFHYDVVDLHHYASFLRSVIKSGERWSKQCELPHFLKVRGSIHDKQSENK